MDMDTCNPQLTPEIRQALAAHPDEPLYIADAETQKIYVILEQGKFPQLEEDYIREGLDLARQQIARGEESIATIQQVIAEAKRRPASRT
jgi:hypothetical protein